MVSVQAETMDRKKFQAWGVDMEAQRHKRT